MPDSPQPQPTPPARQGVRGSKLVPPVLPPGYVHRRALHDRLDESFGRRLTTVTAGPGFGKSSLVAAWSADTVCAWCTLERADASLASFTATVAEALRRGVSSLPDDFGGAAEQSAGSGDPDAERCEALAGLLCEALEDRLESDLVLVLDDVQELGSESASARLLDALARQAPPELHLVLSSRLEPPFAVERLRGRGQVLELDAPLLAFSLDEVAELLGRVIESTELAEPVHALTAGWPAAVRLAAESLRAVSPEERGRVLDSLGRPQGPLFEYLAEEVFAQESEEVRALLRTAAPLGRVDAALCARLGIPAAQPILADLAHRGLFVQRESADSDIYTVHALVREYVLERWPLEPEEARALHRRAAGAYEAQGNLDAALRELIASGDGVAPAVFLAARGVELLAGGSVESILEAEPLLAPEARTEDVELVIGEAHAIGGEWDDALACYRRAAGDRASLPPGLAWRIGRIDFDRGELQRALDVYRQGRIDGSDPPNEARLLAWTASAELNSGNLEEGRLLATEALERATACNDARSLAVAHNIALVLALRFDAAQAYTHYRKGVEAAERAGDALQAIRIRSNYAGLLSQQGEHEQALQQLAAAVALGETAGVPLALAFALLKRGDARLHLGQLDLAMADLAASRALYERLGSVRLSGALLKIGEVYRERGDRALAHAALEEALAKGRRVGDVQVVTYAQSNLARVIAYERPDEARTLAECSVETARTSGQDIVFALLSSGWVAHAHGDRGMAAGRATETTLAASERGDRRGIAEALELTALSTERIEPLEEAISVWRELRHPLGQARASLALARLSGDRSGAAVAVSQVRRLGVRIDGASAGLLAALPGNDAAPVVIQTLGAFRVARDGEPVPADAWRSRKAREVLKLLIARRGRSTPRPVLIEALWPGEDPARTPNRLNVALSTARAVLDPEHRVDGLLASGDDAVWLDLTDIEVDVNEFLGRADGGLSLVRDGRADEARELLEAAESMYTGDFLEESPYHDWAVPLREEARAAYVSVATALADLASTAGEHDAAIRYRLRVLERDTYDEQGHLGLVAALASAGRHGEARRAYGAYVSRMEQIGAEPVPFLEARQPAAS